jgi:hypothetical protein
LRASIGCFSSILALAFVREAAPFARDTTNTLSVIGQYQVCCSLCCQHCQVHKVDLVPILLVPCS